MTATCIALDQIESRTATSVALAIYARRIRDGFVALALRLPVLALLNFRLNQLKTPLRSGALDKLSDEQLQEVATLLKQLTTCLARLVEGESLTSTKALRNSRERIQDSIEDFDSILENIFLALDPSFHKAVSSAIDKLKLGVEESAALLR